jgi:hypothetical protein
VNSALKIEFDLVKFYIDSKFVLGYIKNRVWRFYMYVTNRVERILRSTSSNQWSYIPSQLNPADCATRSLPPNQMQHSPWLRGPEHLNKESLPTSDTDFPLIDPDGDKEVKPEISVMKCNLETSIDPIVSHRFQKFSTWRTLARAVGMLLHVVVAFSVGTTCARKGWHRSGDSVSVESCVSEERQVLKIV